MSGVAITALGSDWRFFPEAVRASAQRYQVIASAQLLDELTGAPPRAPISAWTPIPGLSAKASAGGLVGVSGRPAALYPNPWPGVAPSVSFDVAADGFLPLTLGGDLPPQPGFPVDFARLNLGVRAMRRRPTRIAGRAVDATGAPVVGATVAATTIWLTMDALLVGGAAPNGVSLMTGVYADRPLGATVRSQPLLLLPATKTLIEPAPAGATMIRLSDRQALVVGDPLAIAAGDAERVEYAPVAAVDAASSPDQPAWVTLHHPLARPHFAGADVHRTALGAAGAANALTSAAQGTDVVLLANGLAGLSAAQPTLEISGGAPFAEYHAFAPWRATTGADGRFALPPIHRVAHIELTASGGGQPNPSRRIVSLSGATDVVVDFVFA